MILNNERHSELVSFSSGISRGKVRFSLSFQSYLFMKFAVRKTRSANSGEIHLQLC